MSREGHGSAPRRRSGRSAEHGPRARRGAGRRRGARRRGPCPRSDPRPYLAGQQQGRFAYARVDLAWPEAALIHEVAHAVTAGDGHGPVWRAVYLGAIAELYGEDRAAREERRIAWVHDRCYATDSCLRIR